MSVTRYIYLGRVEEFIIGNIGGAMTITIPGAKQSKAQSSTDVVRLRCGGRVWEAFFSLPYE